MPRVLRPTFLSGLRRTARASRGRTPTSVVARRAGGRWSVIAEVAEKGVPPQQRKQHRDQRAGRVEAIEARRAITRSGSLTGSPGPDGRLRSFPAHAASQSRRPAGNPAREPSYCATEASATAPKRETAFPGDYGDGLRQDRASDRRAAPACMKGWGDRGEARQRRSRRAGSTAAGASTSKAIPSFASCSRSPGVSCARRRRPASTPRRPARRRVRPAPPSGWRLWWAARSTPRPGRRNGAGCGPLNRGPTPTSAIWLPS